MSGWEEKRKKKKRKKEERDDNFKISQNPMKRKKKKKKERARREREREGRGCPQRLWISLFIKTPCPHAHKSLIIICYQRCLPNCTERLRDRFFRIGTRVRWSLKAGDKMNE